MFITKKRQGSSLKGNRFVTVPVVPDHIHAINDTLSAEDAAKDYEVRLRELVNSKILDVSKCGGWPRFDLMLLGMGPDGHIASLFPHHPLIHENKKWVTFIKDSPKPPPKRITYTLPVINSAANVVMVITGANLAETLRKVFGKELPYGELPAQLVAPEDGKLVWFVDKEAASKLACHELGAPGS
eukprot:Gb_01260 [translate_table: standard]